uniref:Uncharacterized protein n=1 Tax=Rhizophora mucronata TaxID=61149 RepID=A0A2P2Q4D3_RHIMU
MRSLFFVHTFNPTDFHVRRRIKI